MKQTRKRKFGHSDAMNVKAFLSHIDYTPTIEQVVSCCGLSNVKLNGAMGLIEWLDLCKIEYKKQTK